jgi:hypothetical protein
MDLSHFRQDVRSRFGTVPEFLTKAQASELISELSNGGQELRSENAGDIAEPGAEG